MSWLQLLVYLEALFTLVLFTLSQSCISDPFGQGENSTGCSEKGQNFKEKVTHGLKT